MRGKRRGKEREDKRKEEQAVEGGSTTDISRWKVEEKNLDSPKEYRV
jgi:hypothetical protein